METRLCLGLLGCPLLFLCVDIESRSSDGICNETCEFVKAHLNASHQPYHPGYNSAEAELTHSNLSAASIPGNPETTATISHGLRLARDVRAAPPFTSPLCCFSRRGGFGVDPMYHDAGRTVERRT